MNTFWGRCCSREAVGSAIKRLTSKMLPDFNCLRERERERKSGKEAEQQQDEATLRMRNVT